MVKNIAFKITLLVYTYLLSDDDDNLSAANAKNTQQREKSRAKGVISAVLKPTISTIKAVKESNMNAKYRNIYVTACMKDLANDKSLTH